MPAATRFDSTRLHICSQRRAKIGLNQRRDQKMAVGMLLAGEGVTKDAYVALTEKMFGNYPMRHDQSPEGLLLHTAGASPDGWYIYDVWASKEQFQSFMASRIGPAAAELGAEPPTEPQFFEIETLVKGPAL